ncbi:type IV pilin-like G/H family protein [Kovacikia minuta CCNUW1]|uniref:type IV pilin-like G/H family protein n=1 Tax=Kovacikia minuta TaxID=2931930 RepID=UPI001CCF0E2C|nr:type IV pilin-like G/H family protein [Kovacikia minuta]UBF26025.1 type IV pilin-like G/H family protein [Kovacikia minuta CCNUW1]
MTQPNLLEFAKQGDPEAIATLMNLALQPKGVTAEAEIRNNCLHVFLSSTRLLNQQTLVSFTRKGLINLGLQSIQVVKVYGKKVGEDLPIWTEEFEVSSISRNSEDFLTKDTLQTETQARVADAPETIQPRGRRSVNHNALNHQGILPNGYLKRLRKTSGGLVPRMQSQLNHLLTATERVTSQIPLPKGVFPPRVRPSRFLAALTLITLPAFFLGVIFAVIAAYAGGFSGKSGALQASNLAAQSPADSAVDQDALKQQKAAKTYLEKMNQAQVDYYTKNNRFATNLEDLERSASIISQSYNYTYKLTLLNKKQAQLTAAPKAKGLNSFTAIVFLTQPESGAEKPDSTICESKSPSMIPPIIPVSGIANQEQCPSGATKAS